MVRDGCLGVTNFLHVLLLLGVAGNHNLSPSHLRAARHSLACGLAWKVVRDVKCDLEPVCLIDPPSIIGSLRQTAKDMREACVIHLASIDHWRHVTILCEVTGVLTMLFQISPVSYTTWQFLCHNNPE